MTTTRPHVNITVAGVVYTLSWHKNSQAIIDKVVALAPESSKPEPDPTLIRNIRTLAELGVMLADHHPAMTPHDIVALIERAGGPLPFAQTLAKAIAALRVADGPLASPAIS